MFAEFSDCRRDDGAEDDRYPAAVYPYQQDRQGSHGAVKGFISGAGGDDQTEKFAQYQEDYHGDDGSDKSVGKAYLFVGYQHVQKH